MFIIDLIMNEGITDLNYVGGFYAYRLGEAFLVYLSQEYGRETVADLFYALRISSTVDEAFKKVFGMPADLVGGDDCTLNSTLSVT